MNENQEQYEQQGNPIGGLIRTAIGLGPIGFGAYKMAGTIRANSALNPAVPLGVGQGSSGNLAAIGSSVHDILTSATKDNRAGDLQRLKKVTEEIMDDDKLTRMFQSVAEQNALVQSLLETIDDPNTGFEKDKLLGYREKLIDLARDTSNPDELKEIVQKIVHAISTQAPENARIRWQKNLREYRKLGVSLSPPTDKPLPMTKSYMAVDVASLKKNSKAKREYDALVKALGNNGAGRVRVVSNTFGGQQQFYAQVYSGRAPNGTKGPRADTFLDVLPLQLTPGSEEFTSLFTNENLTTGYALPRHIVDGKKAAELMAGGKMTSAEVIKKAGISPERFLREEFIKRMNPNRDGNMEFSRGGAKQYREWKGQFLELMARNQYSVDNEGANSHLSAVMAAKTNFLNVVNMESMDESARTKLMLDLGTEVEGFESNAPGYQYLVRGVGDQPIGRIGIRANSPLVSIESTGEATRGYFPVESRIEQVFHGGGALFVGDKHRTMGRGGTMTAGPTAIAHGSVIKHVGRNIEWAKTLTGATNKAMLLPTLGDWYNAMEGKGVSYGTGTERQRMFTTKPIIDPGEKGYRASQLFMDDILHETTTDANGVTTRRMRAEGEQFTLTREQIMKHNGFLGFGDQGAQNLRMDPRMRDMQVSYSVTESHGKRHVNIMADVDRDMDVWKGFSTGHKGGVISKSDASFDADLRSMGFSARDRRKLQLKKRDMLIADPSMLKKGAGFFDLQLTHGYGLVSGDMDYRANLKILAQTHHYSSLPDTKLGRTTGAVIKGLSERVSRGQVSPKEAGHVLAAIYARGGKGHWLKGANESMAIEQDQLEAAFQQAFGSKTKAVLRMAKTGLAITASSMAPGTGPGDWALGRGSVEPRFIANLQHRLQTMGMSVDQAGSIIGDVYKNKIGFSGSMESTAGLLRMMEGVTGTAGITAGAEQLMSGLHTYNLADLPKLADPDIGFDKLVQQHPDGFYLNLTEGAHDAGTRAIAANAVDVFKQGGSIFIGGREVSDAMRETFIKQARDISGNAADTLVHGEYTMMMSGLFKSLHAGASRQLDAVETTRAALQSFKEQTVKLGTAAIMMQGRGKIKGMASGFAQPYDLDYGKNFSGSTRGGNLRMARQLFARTKGQATWMDSYGFLSQLNDWMGSNNGAGSEAARDAAKKAEMFFLSSEEAMRTQKFGKAKGVVQLGMRHPLVGIGNITPIQVFRHIEELNGKGPMDDAIFKHMGSVSSQWSGINSWRQLASEPANVRHGFFTDLVNTVGSIAPEGGGSIIMPTRMGKLNIEGMAKPMSMDFGIAAAAIGDFDGDQWMAMMLSHNAGKTLMSTFKTSDEWLAADVAYKVQSHVFTEEAKAGLERHRVGANIGYDSAERARNSLMKEQASKAATGQITVQLDRVKTAMLDMHATGKEGRAATSQAMALLKIVQEHTTIKGKKLPVYMPLAESLTNAVKLSFAENGSYDEFRRVMKEEVFKGSKLNDGSMRVNSMSDSGMAAIDAMANIDVDLNSAMDVMIRAMDVAKVTGVTDMPNAYHMAKYLNGGTPEEVAHHMNLLNAGKTLESALLVGKPKTGKALAASAESLMSRIGSTVGQMDKKLMGLGAAAVAGSLAVMGLVGHGGYAPEPMVVPGEVMSPDVRAAIGRGDALGPSPDSMRQRQGQYDMMGGQQNTPITYLTAPNAYRVRGTVSDIRQMGQAQNYAGSLPGGMRGSVRINDTRRPISMSYLDRMSGEY